jgi:hypothetical protein
VGKHGGKMSKLFLVQDEAGWVICAYRCCFHISFLLKPRAIGSPVNALDVRGSVLRTCITCQSPGQHSDQTREMLE